MKAKVDKYLLQPNHSKRYLYFSLNTTDSINDKTIGYKPIKLEFDRKTKKYIFKYRGNTICHM